ncbi:MAG: SURF1 family protein [Sphingomonadaceae bacterium]
MAQAIRQRRGLSLALVMLVFMAGFVGLGVWQVHRLAWKEALIARVDARVHAAPVPAPGPQGWPSITAKNSEYRRVSLSGHFEHVPATLVQAVTDKGSGFWVLAPFTDIRGFTVLVNRGFVPDRKSGEKLAPSEQQRIIGLLRITEPGGGFLQSNQPAANRWFSRDVAAIAHARHLKTFAPYFIDQSAGESEADGPIGGLTVIRFPNNHLSYAITWFVLAAMSLIAAVWLIRERFRPTSG